MLGATAGVLGLLEGVDERSLGLDDPLDVLAATGGVGVEALGGGRQFGQSGFEAVQLARVALDASPAGDELTPGFGGPSVTVGVGVGRPLLELGPVAFELGGGLGEGLLLGPEPSDLGRRVDQLLTEGGGVGLEGEDHALVGEGEALAINAPAPVPSGRRSGRGPAPGATRNGRGRHRRHPHRGRTGRPRRGRPRRRGGPGGP